MITPPKPKLTTFPAKPKSTPETSHVEIADHEDCANQLEELSNDLSDAATSIAEGDSDSALDTIETVTTTLANIRAYLEEQVK
jgi:hypothetical protein